MNTLRALLILSPLAAATFARGQDAPKTHRTPRTFPEIDSRADWEQRAVATWLDRRDD